MKVKREREVAQPCPTLSNPMDCSLPGSAAPGIFQARVLEWGAIAFSNGYLVISTNIENNFLISDALLLTEIFIWIKFNIILILQRSVLLVMFFFYCCIQIFFFFIIFINYSESSFINVLISMPGLIAFLHRNFIVPVPSTNNLAFPPV